MSITKEQIIEWFDEKRFPIKTEALANLITQCFNDLSPKWISVDEFKPKQGERVLLKTEYDENCPYVVGYWGCGEWEACTVNIEAEKDYNGCTACVERLFENSDVTHWMPLPEKEKC